MKLSKQQGYTVVELLIVVWGIIAVLLFIGLIYVAIHFIQKFW